MFGGKDDYDEYNERASAAYDDDYIALTEEYRSDTVSSDSVSHEKKENTLREVTSEYRRDAFEPYLKKGERLLYVFSRADVDLNKKRKSMKNFWGFIILGLFIGCFSAFIINFIIAREASYTLLFLPFLLLPFLVFFGVIVLIVWTSALNNKTDYAVTDRRILMLLDKFSNEMSYDDVTSVTCSVKRDGTGKVRIISKSRNVTSVFTIPCVKEPEHLRTIIAEAVRKYQSSIH